MFGTLLSSSLKRPTRWVESADQMDGLLPHLGATLKQARLDAGLSLRDMESYGRERSNLRKVEAAIATIQKYWPNLDEYVGIYSEALQIPEHVFWDRAVKRMRKAAQ